MRALVVAVVAGATVVSLAIAAPGVRGVDPKSFAGWALYDRYCLACHGTQGDGRGPAAPFTWGRPRAFAAGMYEWRSTPIGSPPTDEDLRIAIKYGAPGTSMPAFGQVLTDVEVERIVDVIKAFSPPTFANAGKPVTIGPPRTADASRGAALWSKHGCDKCHGERGHGDGPSAKGMTEPPYDLANEPVRRPRSGDDADSRRRAIVTSIATGMSGTAMPGYAGPVNDADLWALADHVIALNAKAKPRTGSALDDDEIAADRVAKLVAGMWPGSDPDEARVFGGPLRPQGAAPEQLAPAQASLSAKQCARCHAKQAREWTPSVHASASAWGLGAREADHANDGDSCNRCHTPLAEQQPSDVLDPQLRTEGVNCAGCHVRNWVRHGPPKRAPSLLPAPGYPLVEMAIYERSDFCMGCHQLPPRTAVNGKPLLNTYKEWLEGPYMRRGIQCQHCHMPNREHTWLGVHDRDTVRQGIRLDARSHRHGGAITVVATLTNIGAGHYLPTTSTPALLFRIELVDKAGKPIKGARDETRIARDVEFTTAWQEKSDTRIPPGAQVKMVRAWQAGRTKEAAFARVTIEVVPEAYYERLYTGRLAARIPTLTRTQYEAALARAKAARFIAEERDVPIALSSSR